MAAPGVRLCGGRHPRRLDRFVLQVFLLGGLVGVIVGVQLLVLLVLGRFPTSDERAVLAVSMIAAAVAALLYQPARSRLEQVAESLLPAASPPTGDVLTAFAGQLSRAVPLDQLLLELAEALRRGLLLEAAEVWTGSGGLFERRTAAPDRGWASLSLDAAEESVIAAAGVSGPAWLGVWLPALLEGRGDRPLRVAAMAQAGELLGLIVVERPSGGEPFGARDERILAELAQQVGLALRNVRLDSQLQASLDENRRQTEQLKISRARVVSAGDAERRRIERDLHDGAQQQLVALSVNLRLAQELTDSDPAEATAILAQLGKDTESALEGLRELAHGIYPPFLAERGLADALSVVAARAPLPTRLDVAGIGRYPPQVEATVYFCCLEALQNAGKHAGDAASAMIRVREGEGGLLFEAVDEGAGFNPAAEARGAGLTNMTDRLGALGGSLRIESSPGRGARIAGAIPLGR
ncbi:MAG: GAF domain-containing sensor histidine kinase [Thermoleophilaceae bacterium]